MERPLLPDSPLLHRLIQRRLVLSIPVLHTVKLLHVIIEQRPWKWDRHLEIIHVALQFRQIHGSPGAKTVFRAAPVQKLPHHLLKVLSPVLQLPHIHVGDFRYLKMQLSVNLRPDQPVELALLAKRLVQLNRADFYDFKWKMLYGVFFSVGALVPFEIQNNVVHSLILSSLSVILLS